jgi:CBS domain containing-hemolysin-like protein
MKKKKNGEASARSTRRVARLGLSLWVWIWVFGQMSSIRVFAAESGGHAFEDTLADILTWVVLIVAPVVLIGLFLILHILPEKIAERRKHPQLQAIKTLCILSLFFGGLLWPLAWLWAFTKPVMYKMAYGTEVAEPEEGSGAGEAERKAA